MPEFVLELSRRLHEMMHIKDGSHCPAYSESSVNATNEERLRDLLNTLQGVPEWTKGGEG